MKVKFIKGTGDNHNFDGSRGSILEDKINNFVNSDEVIRRYKIIDIKFMNALTNGITINYDAFILYELI